MYEVVTIGNVDKFITSKLDVGARHLLPPPPPPSHRGGEAGRGVPHTVRAEDHGEGESEEDIGDRGFHGAGPSEVTGRWATLCRTAGGRIEQGMMVGLIWKIAPMFVAPNAHHVAQADARVLGDGQVPIPHLQHQDLLWARHPKAVHEGNLGQRQTCRSSSCFRGGGGAGCKLGAIPGRVRGVELVPATLVEILFFLFFNNCC